MNFVNSQRDPRLNEILFPYCTAEKAQELINKYEQSQFNIKVIGFTIDESLHVRRHLLTLATEASVGLRRVPALPDVGGESDRLARALRFACRYGPATLALLYSVFTQHLPHR